MDPHAISVLAGATLAGSMPFPEIVGKLIAQGVEYYHVDYATRSFTFYGEGVFVTAPLAYEALPVVALAWDAPALKAAILDSQQHGQPFRTFCERAMRAGVQGYFAFLAGKRVVYMGRHGDQHVEWFPGAGPREG